jgi:ADP-ribose pyrophosphatase YjhB (NUDIX family)
MSPTIRIRAAGILVHEGRILLVRHEKGGRSYWLLPGGGVDFGETVAEGLKREFMEEVGLEVEVGKLVMVHDSIPPDRHRQVLNLYFNVTCLNPDVRVTPDGVLQGARFHPLEDLPRLTVYPAVKSQLAQGIAQDWPGACLYLGNHWQD